MKTILICLGVVGIITLIFLGVFGLMEYLGGVTPVLKTTLLWAWGLAVVLSSLSVVFGVWLGKYRK